MTATMVPDTDATPSVSYFSQTRDVASEETNAAGNLEIKGLKVFRTGTFRDSQGRKKTWTEADLDKMVSNFESLRASGLFIDVPVRADHSISVNSVVGYFQRLYRSGDFLLLDYEFTEPDAAEKWQRKTFRSRSLEVGPYLTNDDQLFYPVASGLAFVDVGAIEHLHRAPENKETPEVTTTETPAHTFRIKGVTTSDFDAVQAHIDELQEAVNKPPEVHKFRLPTGEEVQDYAKVQSTLDTFTTMFSQLRDQTRSNFVKQLATDNKIAATGIDAETEFVKTLNDEQFETYRKRWEGAPAASLFSAQGGNAGENGGPPAPPADAPEQSETDLAVVAQFRRAGQSQDTIKELPSYKRLVAAGKAPF